MAQFDVIKKEAFEAVVNALETNDAQVQSSIANATALAPVNFPRASSDDLTAKPSTGSPSEDDVSYYFKGNSYLQLVIWDGAAWQDHGTPIPTNKVLQNYYKIKDEDVQKMWGLIQSGGVRYAILGDSTEAGRPGSSSPYAETNRMGEFSHASLLAHALMTADPNFIEPSQEVYDVTPAKKSTTTLGDSLLPHYKMIASETPSLNFSVRVGGKTQPVLTVYFIQRTSDAAPEFDVTIYDDEDTEISTETFDSYTGQLSFGAVSTEDVKGIVVAKQISLVDGGSNLRDFQVKLDNLTLVDRGSGVASDGTLVVLGFSVGYGVDFRNYAVSSMTLKNSSSANVDRGVTTAAQLAKAAAFDANVFFIGYGTNDSKDGVSDIATFKTEYKALISDIYTHDANALIILSTDPRGAEASDYENNYLYNAALRELALENELSIFDVEALTDKFPSSNIVDDVHPSSEGYQTLGHALARAFGCSNVGVKNAQINLTDTTDLDNTVFTKVIDPTGKSSFTGSLVEVATMTFNKGVNDKNLEFGAKIMLGRSAADLDDCEVQLSIVGYEDEDGGGTASSEVVIDLANISESQVSGTTKTCVNLHGWYPFNNNRKSVKVLLKASNYQLQTSGGDTYLYAKKLNGNIVDLSS